LTPILPGIISTAIALVMVTSALGGRSVDSGIVRQSPTRTTSTPPEQAVSQATPSPSPSPPTSPVMPQQPEDQPYSLPSASPSHSPSATPALLPARIGPGLVYPPLNNREIVVTAVGDVMLGTTFPDETGGLLPPNDGADLLTEVTPTLKRGDVVFGNLEGPLVDGAGTSGKCRGKAPGHCYAFRVPTRYGALLKAAGFNVMGLANNHAMDFGQDGRTSSRQTLEAQGIAHTGEIGDIAHLTVKGEKISVIAFATYPGAYNLLDLDDAVQAIRQARADADLVIVSFHGGGEGATHQHVLPGDEMFLGEDRGDLRLFTHAAIDAGAGLVLGSGPHVVRGMELYQGKLIAYSLGNFATYGPFNLSAENGISLILEAHLAPDGSFISGQAYPVKQEKPGGPKLDAAMSILPVLRNLSTEDFGANGIVVGPRGELWQPGVQVPECSNAPDLLDQPIGTRPCGIYP
jgi:Bacterial capsule synthesis protein PGA_cap